MRLVLFIALIGIAAVAAKPNIVFILADDLGYQELGSYGQTIIKTPHLDKLATQGMRLTRHYSGSPVCAPSRCVLMTSKHPGHATIRNNGEVKPEGQRPLLPEELTIADRLKTRGYATGAFGKWGLGFPGSVGDPLNKGFDRFFGFNCQRHAHSFYPDYLWSDDKRIALDNSPPVPGHAKLAKDEDPSDPKNYEKYKGKDYAADRIIEQVLSFIRSNKDRPFYCYYPTLIPHLALHVPDEELKPYLALGWDDPPHSARYTPHFTPRAAYAAMISRLDKYVGRIMNLLEKEGLADNTIIVFTSDNGATFLGPMAEFFTSVGDLRGLKGQSYEGGIRVPAIVRYPGKVKPGSQSDVLSGFEDWSSTLLEWVDGKPLAKPVGDGQSLVSALTGTTENRRPFLYREFAGYGGHQAVWIGKWKGIRVNLQKSLTAVELYNLEDDPSESKDLSGSHPEIVSQIRQIMRSQHTPNETFPLLALDAPDRLKKPKAPKKKKK
ncbi:MAG: arylsulfatase A [Rhodothermales bacterium]|jgi:arylsulfatase A